MGITIYDRVQETTSTVGTGSITLNGALSGFLSFNSTVAVSNTTYYGIVDDDANIWEVGIGTLTSSNTLSRDTILSSSIVTWVGDTVLVDSARNDSFYAGPNHGGPKLRYSMTGEIDSSIRFGPEIPFPE
jgi:hypothetical protein